MRSSYATRELATEQIATGSALIAFLKQDCIAFGVCIECIVEDSIEFNIVCMGAMLGMGGMVVAVVMIIIFCGFSVSGFVFVAVGSSAVVRALNLTLQPL